MNIDTTITDRKRVRGHITIDQEWDWPEIGPMSAIDFYRNLQQYIIYIAIHLICNDYSTTYQHNPIIFIIISNVTMKIYDINK